MTAVVKDLKIGTVYRVIHTRKGEFIAQLIDFEECDDVDPIIMVMKYDVRAGTDQAHMQTGPGDKQKVRVSGIRPSLVTLIEPTEEQKRLREVKVVEEKIAKPEGFLKKFFGK